MIAVIIQARMSSTRFPGKVLMPLLGKPMLKQQIDRLARSRKVDRIIIATTEDSADDPLEQFCLQEDLPFFRGSQDDVLDRYYHTARRYQADDVIRVTSDCPLNDPFVIDDLIDVYQESRADYASNVLIKSYPHGLDAEIFSFRTLEKIWKEATKKFDREHVTEYLLTNPDYFKIAHLTQSENLNHLRLTVDYPEDLEVVSRIYQGLYPKNPEFTTQDVVNFLTRHPELLMINEARIADAQNHLKV